jgi:hypothetical protein
MIQLNSYEESILNSVKCLLAGRVNEILGEGELRIPAVEVGGAGGGSFVVPAICLSGCERTEKERVIRVDAYSVTITFVLPETPESELFCYVYAGAVDRALREDPTLGGTADYALLVKKEYKAPKRPGTGGPWELVLSLRVTVEAGNR